MGVIAIIIDKIFLEPKEARFRLHAMPLAVGMYLPWTVTVPMLFGGLAYLFVERRSINRGDSELQRDASIHRGLLFSSGIVAGEAIMGILTALVLLAQVDIPLLKEWSASSGWVDVVSLVALASMVLLLIRTCSGSSKPKME